MRAPGHWERMARAATSDRWLGRRPTLNSSTPQASNAGSPRYVVAEELDRKWKDRRTCV